MVDVYVGLGSNIDPERNVASAIAALERAFGALRCSGVYKSPAYGFAGNDFLNLVVGFASSSSPATVEDVLSALEQAAGRGGPDQRGGSRTLDLDLLLVGRRVDAALRLPRADVLLYPFVLAPLAELAPALAHPVTGMSLARAWARMRATGPDLSRLGEIAALR
jgi:2-amino-4-hydroxy-6-hydroxymethyldihydropteridine diphosphokinase